MLGALCAKNSGLILSLPAGTPAAQVAIPRVSEAATRPCCSCLLAPQYASVSCWPNKLGLHVPGHLPVALKSMMCAQGAIITHGAVLASLQGLRLASVSWGLRLTESDSLLSMLPLAGIFDRCVRRWQGVQPDVVG